MYIYRQTTIYGDFPETPGTLENTINAPSKQFKDIPGSSGNHINTANPSPGYHSWTTQKTPDPYTPHSLPLKAPGTLQTTIETLSKQYEHIPESSGNHITCFFNSRATSYITLKSPEGPGLSPRPRNHIQHLNTSPDLQTRHHITKCPPGNPGNH